MVAAWLLSLLSTSAVTPIKLGDLDGDGQITVLDLVKLINYLQPGGASSLSAQQIGYADVNEDGAVNQLDLDVMQDVILGITTLPDPLSAPVVASPVTSTNGTNVVLIGTARPNRVIIISGGLFTVTTTADANGHFEIDVPLRLNRVNTLFLTASNAAFAASVLQPLRIIQDSTPPNLYLDFPSDGSDLTTSDTAVAGRVGDVLSGFMGLSVIVSVQTNAAVFTGPANVDVGIGNNGTFERSIWRV